MICTNIDQKKFGFGKNGVFVELKSLADDYLSGLRKNGISGHRNKTVFEKLFYVCSDFLSRKYHLFKNVFYRVWNFKQTQDASLLYIKPVCL